MKFFTTCLFIVMSTTVYAASADLNHRSELEIEDVHCLYGEGKSQKVQEVGTTIGPFTCAVNGRWEKNICSFNDLPYPEGTDVGPYECDEGKWVHQ